MIGARGRVPLRIFKIDNFRSFISQQCITVGTIPIFALPGFGGYPLGILTHMGISTCNQGAAILDIMSGSVLVLLKQSK